MLRIVCKYFVMQINESKQRELYLFENNLASMALIYTELVFSTLKKKYVFSIFKKSQLITNFLQACFYFQLTPEH